ncbi:MAG: carbon starvation protein A [Phycisphaeraceae bacterium]|nr:carbon starvation protein A [Phycisphaeraceae bacterium]
MDTLILMCVCFGGYILAYHTYGKFLAKRIFNINPQANVPSSQLNDGVDYVPTRRGVVFGHHFTSIAGTGPIVGPAIGIIWGWVPAVLWIFFGSIFMGAVHDFGALVISLRNQGHSLSEIAAKYINRRVRFLFFIIVFLSLCIVIAVFGVVIALVFKLYPESILPVWLEIPIALGLGVAIYKRSANVILATIVAVVTMYLTVWLGARIEQVKPGFFAVTSLGSIPATGVWTIILLVYAWVASTLPVTTLLQPRDYINAWQLFVAMALLVLGVVVASCQGVLPMAAPAFNQALPAGTPPIWPLMFVTIACGAISGFHSLVSSGTSAKQLSNEQDSLPIGYGSMLTEGALAVLVIICVGAGIAMSYETVDGTILQGSDAWHHLYSSWAGQWGLDAKLGAFVSGAANIINTLKLPHLLATAVMGVFVASFAGTTLDTSVRLQRYVVSEMMSELNLKWLSNRWAATSVAVLSAAGLAFATGVNGTGALKLWPLFGATNQLLAALALLLITLYLRKKGGWKFLVSGIPCLIMLVITSWAMVLNEIRFVRENNTLLITVGGIILGLAFWVFIESLVAFFRPQKSV